MTARPASEPEERAPRPRLGPRPLQLHLWAALLTWQSSLAALPRSSNGSPPSKAAHPFGGDASQLARVLADAVGPGGKGAESFAAALEREVRRRLGDFHTGLTRYRHHPYRRAVAEPPVLWREGETRMLDYGAGSGRPVMVVPSLINRAYILDLGLDTSLMRYLAARGSRPLLVDWGRPGDAERGFGLDDYIAGRLERALDAAREQAGGVKPVVLGYCMGGNLALALALRRQREIAGLALLATPWDFHAPAPAESRFLAASLEPLWPALEAFGELPVDLIQALFAALDPLLVARKFLAFAALDPDSAAARAFVALEDWVNDGVPLALPVAKECVVGWYGRNETAMGAWRVGGAAVMPGELRVPALAIVPGKDRIVPPGSAEALARAIPRSTVLRPPLGHIGMIVGSGAERLMWAPLARWLAALDRRAAVQ